MRRTLFEIRAPSPGPTLVGLGGMHGNEPAGIAALGSVSDALAESGLLRGEFVALAGNLPALASGVRYVDRDLNRLWDEDPEGADSEARQLRQLREELIRVRDRARGPVHLVDLHTTSGDGPPFTILGDTLANRAMALTLPVPMVLGLADALPGTLVESLDVAGVTSLAFEAGQHDDPQSAQRSADALWLLLGWLGMIPARHQRTREPRRRLRQAGVGFPNALRLVHRHALRNGGDFRMQSGLSSFVPVQRGQVLAHEYGVPVTAPTTGHILLPLYQTSGEDGFFVGRPIRRSWLRMSAALRRRRVDRLLRFLPGVRPEPGPVTDGLTAFQVHPMVRRVFFPALFRLLGYRVRQLSDGRYLLARRPEPSEVAHPSLVPGEMGLPASPDSVVSDPVSTGRSEG
jgi:predicted deacylase